jgi:hypothetical protein
MLHQRVKVEFILDNLTQRKQWFEGIALCYRNNKYHIHFDDGDKVWVKPEYIIPIETSNYVDACIRVGEQFQAVLEHCGESGSVERPDELQNGLDLQKDCSFTLETHNIYDTIKYFAGTIDPETVYDVTLRILRSK